MTTDSQPPSRHQRGSTRTPIALLQQVFDKRPVNLNSGGRMQKWTPAFQEESQPRYQKTEEVVAADSVFISEDEEVEVKVEDLVDEALPLGDPLTLLAYPSTGGEDYISTYISNDLFGAVGPSRETFTHQPDAVAYLDYSSGHHGAGSGHHGAGSGHHGAGSGHHGAGSGHHGAGSGHHGAGSGHHGAGSDHHGSGSGHHGAGSGLHGAGSDHHGASSGHHGAGSWHHGAGSWHHGASSWHHGAGSWHHGAGSDHHGVGSSYSRTDSTDAPTNSPSYFNSGNVNESPDLQVIGQQYSIGSPATPFSSSHNYYASGHAGHLSASPTSRVCHDSDSSGYSSTSPGAISASSISSHSSSGPGPEAPPQDLNIRHGNPGPSGYQTNTLSRGQQYSHYYQESGTSPAAAAQEMGYYASSGSDASGSLVASCSSNALSVPSVPKSKSLPSFSQIKLRKVKLEFPRREARNGSNSPGPKEDVQTFARPSSSMSGNGPMQLFSHPQQFSYIYDSPAYSSSTTVPRINERLCYQPFIQSLHSFAQSSASPGPSIGQFHPQMHLSSYPGVSHQPYIASHGLSPHGVSIPPNQVSRTPSFMAYSRPDYYDSSNPSSSSTMPSSSMPPSSVSILSPCERQVNLKNLNPVHRGVAQARSCIPKKQANVTRTQSRVFNPQRQSICEKCGVKVASSGHLHRHKDSHGADRRFRCTNCDCAFSRQDNLKNHMARAHGIGEVTINKKKRKTG